MRGVVEPLLSGGDGAHSEADGDYVPAGAASSGSTRSGAGRVELLVVWPEGDGRESRFVVECKLVGEGRSHARTVEKGLVQTAAYMDLSGTDAGHLVVFDIRSGRTWGEKVFREESAVGGGDCGVGGIGAGRRAHRTW